MKNEIYEAPHKTARFFPTSEINLLRNKVNSVDKALKYLNTLHNTDYLNEYNRNSISFNKLTDLAEFNEKIAQALEDEKDLFLKVMQKADVHYIEHYSCIKTIQVGKWWQLLFGVTAENHGQIFLPGSAPKLEPYPHWSDAYTEGHGDGVIQTRNQDEIKILHLNEAR